ncbi:MAG: repair protein RecO [Actinomycetota bacterium]|jgi:DNA repair protein RecO (recombination protein O)
MPHYRDEGIILRTHKLGEVDRILTILTKDHGQIRAVAKGVRKTSSRFGARLEPFMVADLQLYEGKNLDTVSQVEQLASYGAQIVADYPKYTAANAMVEAAERLTRESSNSQQYLLLLGGLRALAGSDYEGSQVLDSYLLRALSLSGWVPELGVCHSCQSQQPQSFSVHTGHVSCANCALPGAVKLGSIGLEHMRNLLAGNWPEVAVAEPGTKSNVSSVISAYLQWQLERGLRSMSMVERA